MIAENEKIKEDFANKMRTEREMIEKEFNKEKEEEKKNLLNIGIADTKNFKRMRDLKEEVKENKKLSEKGKINLKAENLTEDKKLIKSYRDGLGIHWKDNGRPYKPIHKHQILDEEKEKIVEKQVQDWLKRDIIEDVSRNKNQQNVVFIINPLSIVSKKDLDENGNKKWRITLDPSYWQKRYTKPEFVEMNGLKSLVNVLEKGDYAMTFDIKDGFLHLKLKEEDKKYLCFESKGKVYRFNKFIWGPSTTPAEFNKLMGLVEKKLNGMKIRNAHHSDDWVILGKTESEVINNAKKFIRLCNKSGLQINISKSKIYPTQFFRFVGYNWDTREMATKMNELDKMKALDVLEYILNYPDETITKQNLYSQIKKIHLKTSMNYEMNYWIKKMYALGVGHGYYDKTIKIDNYLKMLCCNLIEIIEKNKSIFKIKDWKEYITKDWKLRRPSEKNKERVRILDALGQEIDMG